MRMKHISSQFKRTAGGRERGSERGDLMEYFLERLNGERRRDGLPPMTMGRVGKLLQGIPTKDLYYLKSVCDKARNFSKKFWWEVSPKKQTEGNDRSPRTDEDVQ